MKKISKSLLSSIIVASAASSFAVACGPKENDNVVFALTQETVGGQPHIINAYKELVNNFNEQNKGSKDHVNVTLESYTKNGVVRSKISTGEALPDLFTSYQEEPATLSHLVGTKDKVRDMASSFGSKFEDLKKELNTDVYLKENEYNNKLLVLPFGKSVDLSVINVKFLIEFLSKLEIEENTELNFATLSNEIKTSFNQFNTEKRSVFINKEEGNEDTISNYKVFKKDLKIRINKEEEALIATLKTIHDTLKGSNSNDISSKIRSIFNSNETIINLTKIMSSKVIRQDGLAYLNADDTEMVAAKPDTKLNHFSFGIDSTLNQFFSSFAIKKGTNVITTDAKTKPENLAESLFFRTSFDDANATGRIAFNKNSESFKETAKFLEDFRTIARSNMAEDEAKDSSKTFIDYDSQWQGTLDIQRTNPKGKQYVASSFINGTTFMSSGSSASAFRFQLPNSRFGKSIVKDTDVIVSSKNEKFMSQGYGISGFKSVGKNATNKEKTVEKFLNFIVQPKEQAQFSLRSNYMPSTQSALNIYQAYIGGVVDNSVKAPTLINESNKEKLNTIIANINEKSKLLNGKALKAEEVFVNVWNDKNAPAAQAIKSAITSDFISTFLQDEEKRNSSLYTLAPSPVGVVIRNAVNEIFFGKNSITDLNPANKNRDKNYADTLEVNQKKSESGDYTFQKNINKKISDILKEFVITDDTI